MWESSFLYLFIYLFLQLIFIECPLIFTLSSWSGKGNGHREEKVREKNWLTVWTQKVGMKPREYIEHSNSILQGRPRVSLSRVAGCLDYMFVLSVFRDKFPSLTSRDTGAILRGKLAGCHHTYINLLYAMPCHPVPWEALSSHTSSARKVSMDTSVCITECDW